MGEFYKTFKEVAPLFLKLLQNLQEEGRHPSSFYKASIIYFQKSDKDTRKKENCRPIFMMNIDAKILNKMLAIQFQQYTENIVHHDQVGFILGMQGWYNIHKSINVTQHITKWRIKPHDRINRFRKSIW